MTCASSRRAWCQTLAQKGGGVGHSRFEREITSYGHGWISEETGLATGVLQDAVEEYHKDFHRYPSGDNRSILRQLAGLNPKKKVYGNLTDDSLDGRGVAVDLWNEPYVFDFRGDKARVYSRRYDLDLADQKRGRLWPGLYDPLSPWSKEDTARADRYKLALAIRLLVQQSGKGLSLPETLHALYNSHQILWPKMCFPDAKMPAKLLDDPWGSRYVIKLAPTEVVVSSVHLPGEVSMEPLTVAAKSH